MIKCHILAIARETMVACYRDFIVSARGIAVRLQYHDNDHVQSCVQILAKPVWRLTFPHILRICHIVAVARETMDKCCKVFIVSTDAAAIDFIGVLVTLLNLI